MAPKCHAWKNEFMLRYYDEGELEDARYRETKTERWMKAMKKTEAMKAMASRWEGMKAMKAMIGERPWYWRLK